MIGRSRRCASARASALHGHQSTGFVACSRRYGLVSASSRRPCGSLSSRIRPARARASARMGRRLYARVIAPAAGRGRGEPMQQESTAAGEPYTVLKLKHREEQRILAGHLWVFSNEIDTLATPLANVTPGATVQLRSSRDRFLGWAYANPHSLITARILSRD